MTRRIDVSLINANNVSNGYVIAASGNTAVYQPVFEGYPVVCNDIGGQFDGDRTVFPIMVEQDYINTIADSRNIQVAVAGQFLSPYLTPLTYPWILEYDSFKGFRVRGSNVTIYNVPDVGDSVTMTIVSNNSTAQKKRYPYSATTIALGE